jgi:tetratricopeptide (TPR) repeat protein
MDKKTLQNKLKNIRQLMVKEDWQTALDGLFLLEKENPDMPAVLTAIGDCQIHLNKPESAIISFRKVIDLEQNSIEAYNNLGVAYMFSGEFEKAETAYLHALQFKPDHIQTLKNLAFLYYQQENRLGDAAQILAGIIKSFPEDCDALFLMGQCYEMGDDPASAKQCYQRILLLKPDSVEAKEALQIMK